MDGQLFMESSGKNAPSKESIDERKRPTEKNIKPAPIYPTPEGFSALTKQIGMIINDFEVEQKKERKLRREDSTMEAEEGEEEEEDGRFYEDPKPRSVKLGMTDRLNDSVAHGDCKCPKCLNILIDYIQEELNTLRKRQNRFDNALDRMSERQMLCLRSICAILPYEETPL